MHVPMSNGDSTHPLDRSRAALLTELGAIGHEAFPRDPLTRGLEVYVSVQNALREIICHSVEVRRSVEKGNKLALWGVVTDIIASHFGQLPAGTIAALLVQDGIAGYCEVYWAEVETS